MPLYEYKCAEHGFFDGYAAMVDSARPGVCPVCRADSPKIIRSAPRVFGDFEPYESPASGKWIEGRRQRLEDMKQTNCREWEPGEHKDQERIRKERIELVDRQVDEAVDRTVGELRSN